MATEKVDLTGKTFGLLAVISDADVEIHHRNTFWKCRCECGNTLYVSTTNLHMGVTDRCNECKGLEHDIPAN